MQTRTQSLIESASNVAIGYVVAITAQLAVFPMFGINIKMSDNLLIGAIFTVVSIARSYAIRRFFNIFHEPKK